MIASVFSTWPRIETDGGKLRATSSWLAYLSCLGLYSCEVVVDPKTSLVSIVRRIGWFCKTERQLRFGGIQRVAYGYQGPRSTIGKWLADDPDDYFSVGLWLRDQAYIHLFYFRGSGRGTAAEDSKTFACDLARLIGVPVGR